MPGALDKRAKEGGVGDWGEHAISKSPWRRLAISKSTPLEIA
jgi:hypothetical protein